MRLFRVAFPAAVAAALLLAAGAASVASAKSLPDEVPPPMSLAFRVVDESADPEAIFQGGENLPDGFEAAGGAALWRRVGPPPDAGELARIARFADRPGCDLVLEPRIVDGETFYAPLFVFSTPELTGNDVMDAAIRRPWLRRGDVLHFDFHPNAALKFRQLMRTWKAGGSRSPRGGSTTGRFAVLADGRLLGVARRTPFDFPCAGNREEAEAVVQAYRALPATHLFTVTPCKTSGLTATEARDRAAADIPKRWLAYFSGTPDLLLPQIACEGENGLAITLPPGRADRQRLWLCVLTLQMGVTFRPVAPENDAWVRGLFAAPPPEGFETVTAPDGAPAWLPLDGGKDGKAAEGTDGGGDDDDDDDGNPDLGPAAEREGCLLAWENLRIDTGGEADGAVSAYPVRRPCYLSADSVLDVAAVAGAVPVKASGGDENAIRVDLRPEERAVLEDMALALAPGQRIAFLYSDCVQSLGTAEDILSGEPLFICYTPVVGGFDEPKEEWRESWISSIARFLEAGLVPAELHYEGSR